MTVDKAFSIAVSGKGGVGKTNISSLLIRQLCKKGRVLAIDADPDSNLPQALGVTVKRTVGDIREAMVDSVTQDTRADKEMVSFGRELNELVEKGGRFHLVVMGRTEREGCYCAINHVIRQVIDIKAMDYDFIVIDCEPGLEHLSRRTTTDIGVMIVVTDPSLYGLLTAKRVDEVSKELLISFDQTIIVANKVTTQTKDYIDRIARKNGIEIDAYIPYAQEIADLDVRGGSVFELPANSGPVMAVERLCQDMLSS